MRKITIFLFAILLIASCKTQQTTAVNVDKATETKIIKEDPEKYASSIKEAWKLYEQKEYLNSANKYN